MLRRWLPFRFLPASWGLVGDAYLEAEAHYSLRGEALERRLAQIRLCDDPQRLERELVEIAVRYGTISAHQAAVRRVELTHPPGPERDLALLEIEHEFDKIDDITFNKQRSLLKNEPWIGIVNSGFDPSQGIDGVFFEFDWNAQWIDYLRNNGYAGRTDEQVIDEWFADVCRSHTMNDAVVPFSVLRE